MATKAAMINEIGVNFADNTSGNITPAITRTTHTDEVNSWQQAPTINAQIGTSYAVVTADYGALITLSNAAPVAVSLPASSVAGFNPFNVRFKNLGAGTVTVTPTAGNIDGLASISILTGGSVQLVGDGTNYHAASVSTTIDATASAIAIGGTTPSGLSQGALRLSTSGLSLTGINASYGVSGTAAAGTEATLNLFNFNPDTADYSGATGAGQVLEYMTFQANIGGSTMKGGRTILGAGISLNAKSGNAGVVPNAAYVGATFLSESAVNDGGTVGTASGYLAGGSFSAQLLTGATFWQGIGALELDVALQTGTNSNRKIGLNIVQTTGDAIRGSLLDTAIEIGNQSAVGIGSAGWTYGLLFDATTAQWPMSATGTCIAATTGGGPPTVGSAIDFSVCTITNNLLKGPGFSIAGNGNAIHLASGTSPPAGGTVGTGYLMSSTANLGVFFGSGVPTLSAAQGSLYLRTDGSSTSTRLYVNTNGSTGWTNCVTAT